MNQQNPIKFQVGDTVTWTSQAGGNTKTKTGRVIAIVPANSNPRLALPLGFKLKSDALMMRDHESYLIQVGKSKWLYWPLVKYLKPVDMESLLDGDVDIPVIGKMSKRSALVAGAALFIALQMPPDEDDDPMMPGEGCGYDAVDVGDGSNTDD